MKPKKLNNSISLISKVRLLSNKLIITLLEERGYKNISPSHGDILYQLYKHDQMNMKELATAIGRDKSTLTVLVRKVEKLGYVRRFPSLEDGRIQLLSLTEQASDFYPVFQEVSSILNETSFEGFDDKEIDLLISFLLRIKTNLQKFD